MLNHPDYSNLKIKPSDLVRRRHRPRPGPPGDACGCCPACGELIVIEATGEGVESSCPLCGSAFDRLVPLGECRS